MKVLLAGATGAIGAPLIEHLRAKGDTVFGMTHSPGATDALRDKGAEAIVVDALDSAALEQAIKRVRPDAIVNELTALPKHYTPEAMKAAAQRDREVRITGNRHLLAAARASHRQWYVLQSSAFWYAPGDGLADESTPFAFDSSPAVAAGARTYAELESALLAEEQIQGVVLRYGFFYGPGTWYTKHGDMGEQVRQRKVPVIGEGRGVWNFVHVEDAAAATVAALHGAAGVYNVVDDEPSEQRVCFPLSRATRGLPSRSASPKKKRYSRPGPTRYITPRGFGELRMRRRSCICSSVPGVSNGSPDDCAELNPKVANADFCFRFSWV
jgi:nucleoside-diphosphate-sugar epimerase